ncbi:MAG: hypothetical protein JJT78_18080 [Leptospira sp.]|nr:hypothetical protein [Leptospira sp.]
MKFFGGLVIFFMISFFPILNAERYYGSLNPQEPRIKDFKESINEENPNYPEEMHLFFQELAGDFAIFYDLDGHTVHFKYRRNKWDYEAMESVHNLLSGRTYRVKGKFLGIYYYPKNIELRRMATSIFITDGQELDWKFKKEDTTIPVFQLVSYNESYSDSIIFQSPDI